MQIRTRLTLQFLLIVAGILLVAVGYSYFQYERQVREEFFNSLRTKAYLTASAVVGRLEKQETTEILTESNRTTLNQIHSENVLIFNQKDELLFSFQMPSFEISKSKLDSVRTGGERRFDTPDEDRAALGVQFFSPSGEIFVVVAEANFDPSPLDRMVQYLALVFFGLMGVAAALGWMFAARAMAPVSQIVNQVDSILPSNLSQRVTTRAQHDELGRLAATFNKLLDRIEKAFVAQRQFISNVSHELRNPLTIITSQVEVALQKPRSPDDYQKILASVLDDAQSMSETSEKLLQIAKIQSGTGSIQFAPVRMDELIFQVKNQVVKSQAGYSVNFEITNLPDDEAQLSISGNEPLLRLALLNLMDNACKFSSDHRAQVRLFFEKENVLSIEISDRGPGIAEADLPMIFEPFFRSAKTAGVRGSGVGLSLVKNILDLHTAQIRVWNGAGGGAFFGLEFRVGV